MAEAGLELVFPCYLPSALIASVCYHGGPFFLFYNRDSPSPLCTSLKCIDYSLVVKHLLTGGTRISRNRGMYLKEDSWGPSSPACQYMLAWHLQCLHSTPLPECAGPSRDNRSTSLCSYALSSTSSPVCFVTPWLPQCSPMDGTSRIFVHCTAC